MIRSCLRCKAEPYTPAGHIDMGNPILAYCSECVKTCTMCGVARTLGDFPVDKKSEGWITWRRSSVIDPNPDHLPVGDELIPKERALCPMDYFSACSLCMPHPVAIESTTPSVAELEAEINKLLGGHPT